MAEKAHKVPILGSLKGISFAEFEQLRETAAEVDKLQLLAAAATKKADIATKQLTDSKNTLLERKHNITLQEQCLADRREADAREHAQAMERTPDKMLLKLAKERGQELNDHKQFKLHMRQAARELLKELPADIKKALEPTVKALERFATQSFEKIMGRKSQGIER